MTVAVVATLQLVRSGRGSAGSPMVVLTAVAPPLGLLGAVFVVPVPPFVGRRLWVSLRRVLPVLLSPKRGHVEVAPAGAQRLVAAVVDEVGADTRSPSRINALVPSSSSTPKSTSKADPSSWGRIVSAASSIPSASSPARCGLRCTRGETESGVACVQMGKVGDVVGHHRAADAGMLPGRHSGLEVRRSPMRSSARPPTGRAGCLPVGPVELGACSPRPATACADATRPVRHGRGSIPFP